jgi:hypothetical protein
MAYDSAHGQMLLFGGLGTNQIDYLGDTWSWNGTSWTLQPSGSTAPAARQGPSMAYDANYDQVVLFGGQGAPDSSVFADTWIWKGSGWIALSPATSPPARWDAELASDGNQLVLFGGGANGSLNDTWVWDGINWTQQSPATSPSGREGAEMAFDSALGQPLLFGGQASSGNLNDTWAWNGTTWTEQELLASPSARDFSSIVYNSAQNQMLLFGGGNNGAVFGDTWLLETGPVDLGTANVCPGGQTEPAPCSRSATLNFTISNGTVGSIGFLTEGAPNLDFQRSPLVGTCRAGTFTTPINCTVDVTFAPTAAGERNGAVVFYYTDGSVLATEPVYGVGVAPQVVFSPSTQTALGGGFSIQHGVAVDGAGNVYVADTGNNAVKEMPAGCASSSCATALGGTFIFDFPYGVAVDGSGNVYVAEYSGQAVNEIPAGCTSASCVTTLGGGFGAPAGVAVDGSGNVYVADEGNNAVYEMPPGCASSACVTSLGDTFPFRGPWGVAVDGNGNVFVADLGLSYVFEIPANCASFLCVTSVGGGFQTPTSVAVDASGNVYVSDIGAQGMFQIPANCASASCVTKLTSENSVLALALDGSGNLYFSTGGGGAVHELNRSTPPSLTFDTTKGGQTSADSPQTVTLQNVGNAKLTFFAVSYPADFPEEPSPPSTDCSTTATVVAGSDCTLSIDFSPLRTTTPGMLSESVRLTDNALNAAGAAQSVSVSGQGEMGTQASQTITFTPPPSPVTFGVSPIALKATGGGSGNPVTFTIVSGPGKISGSTLTLTGVGTIVVAANQAGNASYTAAPQVTATIVVNQDSQTITFTPPASPVTFGASPIALKATGGGSGNPVTFTIVSGPGKISGSALTMTGLGTIVVAANQAGNASYTAAAQVTATIIVKQGSQTITFTAITGEEHAVSSLKLSATASSDLAVSFASATTAICTVSDTTANLLAAGTCTIKASQAGNTDFAAAPTVSRSFTVLHASQNITFLAITAKEVALSKFKLVATASSKLAVRFASTTPKVCIVSAGEASLLASGTCTIVASQPGNDIFGAAERKSRSFKVLPHSQSIAFPAIANQTVGKSLTLKATASSKLAVSFSSTTTAICKVSGTTASMLTAGTCTIKATQSGDRIYAAAPPVSRSFTVAR